MKDLAEKARQYRINHPDYERSIKIKRYGLDLQTYDAMVEDRGGRCDICGLVPQERLHVDHDHSCCPGRRSCGICVRGLLCRRCNLALGGFDDDIELLLSAVDYLEQHNSQFEGGDD